VFLKIGCTIDGCMSQRKIMKTVIALEKKHVFHHENNFTYQKGALT